MAIYECNSCGAISPNWAMKCPGCNQWGTLASASGRRRLPGNSVPTPLPDIKISVYKRLKTMDDVDRVLGGGLVPDSTVLLGGEPGVGKSTLILQACGILAQKSNVLYDSAEESIFQTKLRAERLDIKSDRIKIVSEPDTARIVKFIDEHKPNVVVIDSIQTVYSDDIGSSPGAVNQIRESAALLTEYCKRAGVCLILVGHITKDGTLAGPKTLEHLVDCVLYFEGERTQSYRVLRCTKNRFGATDETAIFAMTKTGLRAIDDSAEPATAMSFGAGTAICPAVVGGRTFMVEVQSLVSKTEAVPVRRINGIDPTRAAMIMAVMERSLGMSFSQFDVYINVVGGIKVDEPAADLAIAMSLWSSMENKTLPGWAFAGELGLAGEVRAVPNIDARIKESERLGLRICIPKTNKTDKEVIKLARLADVLEYV
ncbi:MAG: DNA repair protein RadA [Planctomycetota bacterium]